MRRRHLRCCNGVAPPDDRGNPLGSPIRDRYPWRLAPALAHTFRAIYVNESRRFLEAAERMSHDHFVYRASLYPSLGYNSVFLGGDEQAFKPDLEDMRHWANTAERPDWTLRPVASP